MAYGFYYGYSRGIIGTVITFMGLALGVVLAFKAIPLTGTFLRGLTGKDHPMMAVTAFVVNILVIMLFLRIVARGIEGVLQVFFLGIVNQILGGVFMAFVSALIFSVLLWFGVRAHLVSETALAGSRTYDSFLSSLPGRAKGIFTWAKPFVAEAWQESIDWMNRVEDFGEKRDRSQPRIYELPDDGRDIEELPENSAAPRRSTSSRNGIEE